MYIIGILIIPITVLTFILTSACIKLYVIEKMLSRQEDSIRIHYPNPLKTYEHIYREDMYSALIFLCSFAIFIKAVMHLFDENDCDWQAFLMYYLLATLFFCLSDTVVFLLRMAAGRIQGTVLFDQKTKTFYVFPSVTTNLYRYKEYHASDLFYLIENYPIDRKEKGVAYVFFTKEEKAYAFKVKGDNQIDPESVGLQQGFNGMSIPLKYRFHTTIPGCLAIIVALLVGCLLLFVY